MLIQKATMKDVDAICEMYEEFFAFTAIFQPTYFQKASVDENYPKSAIQNDGSDILIALENTAIIGFVHLLEQSTPPYSSHVPHRFAELRDIFVGAPHRGKGVGSVLILAAKEWAKERALDYLELSVQEENVVAIQLYKRENFGTAMRIMRCPLE